MIGNRYPAQAPASGRLDHLLGAAARILGKKRVGMEIESMKHGRVRFPLWAELL
jgi:hypothetical protein